MLPRQAYREQQDGYEMTSGANILSLDGFLKYYLLREENTQEIMKSKL